MSWVGATASCMATLLSGRSNEFPLRSTSIPRFRHLSHTHTSISIALQSFFSGKTEKVDEVLYSRFTSPVGGGGAVQETLEGGKWGGSGDGEATPAAAKPDDVVGVNPGEKKKKKRKKERWSEERKAEAKLDRVVEDAKREASGVARDMVVEKKVRVVEEEEMKRKKKVMEEKKVRKKREEGLRVKEVTKEERVSGPGNAGEAMEMRERLGFVTNVDGMGVGQGGRVLVWVWGWGRCGW